MTAPVTEQWFVDHANIVTLAHYLADTHESAKNVAYAVEKPWKYGKEFVEAVAESRELDLNDEATLRSIADEFGIDADGWD